MRIKSRSGGQMARFWGQSSKSHNAGVETATETARKAVPEKSLEWPAVIESRSGFSSDGRLQLQTAVWIGYA